MNVFQYPHDKDGLVYRVDTVERKFGRSTSVQCVVSILNVKMCFNELQKHISQSVKSHSYTNGETNAKIHITN